MMPSCCLLQLSCSQINVWWSQNIFSRVLHLSIVHNDQFSSLFVMISSRKKYCVHADITFKKFPYWSADTQPSSDTCADAVELNYKYVCNTASNMAWLLLLKLKLSCAVVTLLRNTENTDTIELLFSPGLGQAAQADGPFGMQSQKTCVFLTSLKCGWRDSCSFAMDLTWMMKSRKQVTAPRIIFHYMQAKISLR